MYRVNLKQLLCDFPVLNNLYYHKCQVSDKDINSFLQTDMSAYIYFNDKPYRERRPGIKVFLVDWILREYRDTRNNTFDFLLKHIYSTLGKSTIQQGLDAYYQQACESCYGGTMAFIEKLYPKQFSIIDQERDNSLPNNPSFFTEAAAGLTQERYTPGDAKTSKRSSAEASNAPAEEQKEKQNNVIRFRK